jgi:F-type H+-transporting ATPase subunit delta
MTAGKQDRVAKRYARALFEVCAPTEFDATERQLKTLATAWTSSQEFRQSMLNLATVTGQNVWANQATQRTVQTLVGLRKAAVLPAVAEIFSQLVSEYRKSLSLAVSVAKPVTPEVVNEVKTKLSQALGGEVTITIKHDPALLGGMTIRFGDKLLDRSVAGTLQRLAAQLA